MGSAIGLLNIKNHINRFSPVHIREIRTFIKYYVVAIVDPGIAYLKQMDRCNKPLKDLLLHLGYISPGLQAKFHPALHSAGGILNQNHLGIIPVRKDFLLAIVIIECYA